MRVAGLLSLIRGSGISLSVFGVWDMWEGSRCLAGLGWREAGGGWGDNSLSIYMLRIKYRIVGSCWWRESTEAESVFPWHNAQPGVHVITE